LGQERREGSPVDVDTFLGRPDDHQKHMQGSYQVHDGDRTRNAVELFVVIENRERARPSTDRLDEMASRNTQCL